MLMQALMIEDFLTDEDALSESLQSALGKTQFKSVEEIGAELHAILDHRTPHQVARPGEPARELDHRKDMPRIQRPSPPAWARPGQTPGGATHPARGQRCSRSSRSKRSSRVWRAAESCRRQRTTSGM